tara:strand:- start:4165 stop:4989 length:825 start_codon:yes stop_codon:yes gene_type:complete
MVAMNGAKMILHCGGQAATLDELKAVPMPEMTETYTPLSHHDLATSVARVSMDLLDSEIESAAYALSHKGQRMFGYLTLQNGRTDLVRAVCFRNSYDKHVTAGVAGGLSATVCDNLLMSGDAFQVFRKHTGEIHGYLETEIVARLYRAKSQFRELEIDQEVMAKQEMDDRDAWGFFGQCLGEKIIPPKKMGYVLKDWKEPRHEAFAPRTMWSAFNCVNEHLKGLEPGKIIQAHSRLHGVAMELPQIIAGRPPKVSLVDAEAEMQKAIDGEVQAW